MCGDVSTTGKLRDGTSVYLALNALLLYTSPLLGVKSSSLIKIYLIRR